MLKIVSALHHLYTGCVGVGLLSDANKCTLPYICEHSALECTHIAHVVCAGKRKQSCTLTQHNEMPSILRAFHIAFSSSFPSFPASSLLPFPISLLPPPSSLPSAFPISLLSLLLPSPPLPYIPTSSSLLPFPTAYFLLPPPSFSFPFSPPPSLPCIPSSSPSSSPSCVHLSCPGL